MAKMNNLQSEFQIIVENITAGGILLIIKLIGIALVIFLPTLFLITIIRDWKEGIEKDAWKEGYSRGIEKAREVTKDKRKELNSAGYNKGYNEGFREAAMRIKGKINSKKK